EPCGSRSTARIRTPRRRSPTERAAAVVLLPTPPLGFATTRITTPSPPFVGLDTIFARCPMSRALGPRPGTGRPGRRSVGPAMYDARRILALLLVASRAADRLCPVAVPCAAWHPWRYCPHDPQMDHDRAPGYDSHCLLSEA